MNPGSYSGAISFQSSIHQDIILDVPNPISSSMTVISSSHGFDVPEEKFSPEDAFKEKENVDEISDLEVEVGKLLGMDTLDSEILDDSSQQRHLPTKFMIIQRKSYWKHLTRF